MDQRIYLGGDLGAYGTRRYPRGFTPSSGRVLPGGGTPFEANPITVAPSFQSTVAPHATDTERWRYIVPLNRRAKIDTLLATMLRASAAAPADTARARISIVRANVGPAKFDPVSGASVNLIDVAQVQSLSNTLGVMFQSLNPGPLELFEGDTLIASTIDFSTGGTMTYNLSAALIEFDAGNYF